MNDRDTIDQWIEWKRQCALGLCAQGTQWSLAFHVARRFHALCQKFAHTVSPGDTLRLELDDNQCWHLFETHVLVKQTREGKRYKDWVFAKVASSVDPAINAVRGTFDGYIRDAAKEYLRHSYESSKFISMDASAFHGDAGGKPLVDCLLFDPTTTLDVVIRRDYERIGREWGGRVFTDMKRRERIAAFARALGVALSSPVVLRIAGCKKTMLADTHTRWLEQVIMTLKSQFADEGAENVKTLAYFVLTEANELCKKWGSTECDCRPILEIMEVNAP